MPKACRVKPRGEGPFLVIDLYTKLLDRFGPQGWWPGDGPFETIVGAILTQNTTWTNAEKAIEALKTAKLLEPAALAAASEEKLGDLIRPAGYFRQKAGRLNGFAVWLMGTWDGSLDAMFAIPVMTLREMLLACRGIGPETADSILLYAGNKPVFVIDAYTKRIVARVGLTRLEGYDELQRFFTRNLPVDVELYKEYHALLVALGKGNCAADLAKADCPACPVGEDCENRLLAQV